MQRSAAVLLHISSLASPYGIGTMGEAALRFVDFLAESGVRHWQMLPLNPPGAGDSPYQSDSVLAGSPLLLDLEQLVEIGLLTKEQCEAVFWGNDPQKVDFEAVRIGREQLLRQAYAAAKPDLLQQALVFVQHNPWLKNYAAFQARKSKNPRVEERYHIFLQYLFFWQFARLKAYAKECGVSLIGDLPIYPAAESADLWGNPGYFDLTREGTLANLAGVPPDDFSDEGQLWGNPLYNWEKMEQSGYRWWKERLGQALTLFDLVRIDHFRGFESYWQVPAGSSTAQSGCWRSGPGMKLFRALEQELGRLPIIAEDLGILTQGVRDMLVESGFPGMKILQFAFTPGYESDYLPHNIIPHCVVYTGTHDNDTIEGWLSTHNEEMQRYLQQYLRLERKTTSWDVIAEAWKSPAQLAVTTMQDLLALGSESRMNTPGTVGTQNWSWRMTQQPDAELKLRLLELNRLYCRR